MESLKSDYFFALCELGRAGQPLDEFVWHHPSFAERHPVVFERTTAVLCSRAQGAPKGRDGRQIV